MPTREPGPATEPETIRGKARRRLLGIARFFSRGAKAMAAGAALTLGGLYAAFPDGASTAVSFAALAAIGVLFASPVVGLLSMTLRIGGLRREGTLRRDERGLLLEQDDGTVRELGSGIVSGVVAPLGVGYEVHLGLSDGNEISIQVDDETSAERLLDLAGVGHARRSTRVRWASLLARISSGTVGFVSAGIASIIVMMSVPDPWGVPALLMACVAPFLAAGAFSEVFAWREIEVGTDGIAWRYDARRRLLPIRDVVGVKARGEELVVELADGTQRCFRIRKTGFAEGLRRRIQNVLSKMGRAQGKQAFFARGEGSFAEWTERMRGVLVKGTAFRDEPIDVSDAVRVLEDPDAEPEMRVGAALALAEIGEPAVSQKVRVVVDTCVSPKLRVALEEAIVGELDEELLERAQKELRLERREAG